MTTTTAQVFTKVRTMADADADALRGMGVRRNCTKSGYVLASVDRGGVTTVTMWNPLTDDTVTFVADDVDRPAGEFPYRRVTAWTRFGGSAEVEAMWNRRHGIISEGDVVEVFKGRKFPKGMRATVAGFYTWHGSHGVTAEYVVTTEGDRIPTGNVRIVA